MLRRTGNSPGPVKEDSDKAKTAARSQQPKKQQRMIAVRNAQLLSLCWQQYSAIKMGEAPSFDETDTVAANDSPGEKTQRWLAWKEQRRAEAHAALLDAILRGKLALWWVDANGSEQPVDPKCLKRMAPYDHRPYFGRQMLVLGQIASDKASIGGPEITLWVKKRDWWSFLGYPLKGTGAPRKRGRPGLKDAVIAIYERRRGTSISMGEGLDEARIIYAELAQSLKGGTDTPIDPQSIARILRDHKNGTNRASAES